MRPPTLAVRLAALAALLILSPRAAAASSPDTTVVPLPEVVVTGLRARDSLTRLPATAFVYSRGDLERLASPRLTTLLAGVPGLFAYRDGASGDPDVVDPRGFTANGETSYLKVLVDGRDVRGIESGGVDWDWLGPESVERLEVIEGPGAWLYGDGADGGLINIVRMPDERGRRLRFNARGGSDGLRGGTLSFAGPNGILRAGGRDADGWRDNGAEQIRNAGGSFTVPAGTAMRIDLDAGWLDSDRRDPGTLTRDQLDADPSQSETTTDYLHARRWIGGVRAIRSTADDREVSLGGSVRVDDNDQVRTILAPLFHPSHGVAYSGDLLVRHPIETRYGIALTAGAQAERATLDSRYHLGLDENGALLAEDRAHRTTYAAHLG